MTRAVVYGATGYGGVELLRILLQHPDVRVIAATSREPGPRVDAAHPGLRGLTDLALSESRPDALPADAEVVFFALPHGQSHEVADAVARRCPGALLIDLAQDYRVGHEAAGWVYGQPELFAPALPGARRIACPGCFATALLLATGPALRSGVPLERIIVDAKTGSSGSGAAPVAGTHHPHRSSTTVAYKVFEHQHEAEVRESWLRLRPAGAATPLPSLHFVPQSIPLVRGIYLCAYIVSAQLASAAGAALYQQAYAESRFVRVVGQPPNVNAVRGTNNADVFVKAHEGVLLVIATIDNLVKGAAGQAVQCMNLALGLPEDRGLRLAALVP